MTPDPAPLPHRGPQRGPASPARAASTLPTGWFPARTRSRPGPSSTGSGSSSSGPESSAIAGRPGHPGRIPEPSRAHRLAGRPVHGRRLGREGDRPADRHLGHLPAEFDLPARTWPRSTPTTACWPGNRPGASTPNSCGTTPFPPPAWSTSKSGARASTLTSPRATTPYLQFPDRDYYPDTDERQYRRGGLVHWQRTFLQPMLANFDAPVARGVHRRPHRLQHAAAGAHPPQRSDLRRMLPRDRRGGHGRASRDRLRRPPRRRVSAGSSPGRRPTASASRSRPSSRPSLPTTRPSRPEAKEADRGRQPSGPGLRRPGAARRLDLGVARPAQPQRGHRPLLNP